MYSYGCDVHPLVSLYHYSPTHKYTYTNLLTDHLISHILLYLLIYYTTTIYLSLCIIDKSANQLLYLK